MRLPELPEHEARYVRDYVNSQSHGWRLRSGVNGSGRRLRCEVTRRR
jgi:hypothetical protein